MKNCIRPHYEKLKPPKSGFTENSNFENNRDPWPSVSLIPSPSPSPNHDCVVSRKMKLLKSQAEGKKRMKMIGNIEIAKETFIKILTKQ